MRDDDMTEFHDLGGFVTPRQVAAGIREEKTYKLTPPVAGDAVRRVCDAARGSFHPNAHPHSVADFIQTELEAALAQDRASQPSGGGVPEGYVLARREDLKSVRDTLEYWINREDRRGMSETEWRAWHSLGHGSKSMALLRQLLAAAPAAPETGGEVDRG